MDTVLVQHSIQISNKQDHVVCLGIFDGVHLGHRALIEATVSKAKEKNLQAAAVTFFGATWQNRIYTLEQQLDLLSKLGLDRVFIIAFDEFFKNLSPQLFVRDYLAHYIRAKEVICGFNYRFGKKQSGDLTILNDLGKAYGYGLTVIPPVSFKGQVVSSTLIKQYLQEGKMKEVNALLGDPYFISGVIAAGKKLGRLLRFPTINIRLSHPLSPLRLGVYTSRTQIDKTVYEGITNIGTAPTVSSGKPIVCETHLFDFSREIYHHEAKVQLLDFIRAEQRFQNLEELNHQIAQDVHLAKEWFQNE